LGTGTDWSWHETHRRTAKPFTTKTGCDKKATNEEKREILGDCSEARHHFFTIMLRRGIVFAFQARGFAP
jgi:hypothetical protein